MKIEIDTNLDAYEDSLRVLKTAFFQKNNNNPGQQKIDANNNTLICDKCNCNLFDKYDKETVTKIKNYCKIKYKDHIYCKDCQDAHGGGTV